MDHCVARYAARCADGQGAVVSARRNGNRRLTIAFDPACMRVMQASGRHNRALDTQEAGVVDRWVSAVSGDILEEFAAN